MNPEKPTHFRHILEMMRIPIAMALAFCVAVSGCSVRRASMGFGSEVQSSRDIAVTENQVRLRMRATVHPMCGAVEQAANEIIASTDDRAVKLAALTWKCDAIPAIREALFQPDVATAALDTLVLCIQMGDFYETGAGTRALGPLSDRAVTACRSMQEAFTRVLASGTFSGDISKAVAFAKRWAAEHPIEGSISARQTTLARVYELDLAGELSTGEAIASVTSSVDDLNRKLDVYSDQLFR